MINAYLKVKLLEQKINIIPFPTLKVVMDQLENQKKQQIFKHYANKGKSADRNEVEQSNVIEDYMSVWEFISVCVCMHTCVYIK